MVITILQLSQMAVGVWINIYIYRMMSTTKDFYCDGRIEASYFYVYVAFAMYFSYLLLFLHFFFTTYVWGGAAKSRKTTDASAVSLKERGGEKEQTNGAVASPSGNDTLHKRK